MHGCEILEWNIQVDHIHLLMVILPRYAVSDVIGKVKQYYGEQDAGEVCMVGEGVLERAGGMVTGLFRFHGRIGRETNH